MGALLVNGDFEAAWSEDRSHKCLKIKEKGDVETVDEGSVYTPRGWLVWFKHKEGKLAIPEGRAASGTNPERMRSGENGYVLFTVGQAHDSGLLQQITIEPGKKIRFSAWAHAWSNHQDPDNNSLYPHPDDSCWSEGAGYDPFFALEGENLEDSRTGNVTFWVGIDPSGGRNPSSSNVVWGQGAHIYNAYAQVPAVEATAQSESITIFMRAQARYPFKHNDAYWDDADLVVVDDSIQATDPRGTPRIQYERFYVLLPPGADSEWASAVVRATWDDNRYTIGGSADDAGIGDLDSRIVLVVNPDKWGGPEVMSQFFSENYPGVRLRSIKAETPLELGTLLREE
jgi:hypothetical protein